MKIDDIVLLRYLNGHSSPEETATIQSWIAESTDHSKEMLRLRRVWSELNQGSQFKVADTDDAWRKVQSKMTLAKSIQPPQPVSESTTQAVEKIPPSSVPYKEHKTSSSDSSIIPWIAGILGTLLLAFLVWAIYTYFNPRKTTIEVNAIESEKFVTLSDRSTVLLKPVSSIQYDSDIDKQKIRKVTLTGHAQFDINSVQDRPLIVTYDNLSIQTLGTNFTVLGKNGAVTVNCHSGRIAFFETETPTNGVKIEVAESYQYKDGLFENLADTIAVEAELIDTEESPELFSLNRILDWLMENSDWRVISAPGMPIDQGYEISVDLEQNYVKVLGELREKIDITFDKAPCDGCYVVKSMKAKK